MKKKTRYDLIESEIENYKIINKASSISREELFKIFESHINVPTYENLKKRFISAKISSYLGRKKDSSGRRKILSTGNGMFSFIETERDAKNLDGTLSQLNKRIDGMSKNVRKVENRKFFVENQVTFDDIEKLNKAE